MVTLSSTKSPLLDGDHLQVNTVGLSIANYFHPHMVKVKCLSGYKSPYEVYSDNYLLEDAIRRWLDLGNKPSESGIRRILRTRDGVRSVVNFKPAIAQYIYKNYVPSGGTVLDPCAGYSGRLCGLISTGKDLLYHGIDPCPETMIGNSRLSGFYAKQYDSFSNRLEWPFRYRFDLGCAEDILPTIASSSYDLIFTSPPYFNVEQYDTLPTQSYVRYPKYEDWRDNFLRKIFEHSCRIVKDMGYVIYNVKDYKNMPIASDLCKISEDLGMKLVKTFHMRLANSEFHRKEGQDKYHTEPIFVFVK